jgi:hypothetical protein
MSVAPPYPRPSSQTLKILVSDVRWFINPRNSRQANHTNTQLALEPHIKAGYNKIISDGSMGIGLDPVLIEWSENIPNLYSRAYYVYRNEDGNYFLICRDIVGTLTRIII